jgi:hypothetical protein
MIPSATTLESGVRPSWLAQDSEPWNCLAAILAVPETIPPRDMMQP